MNTILGFLKGLSQREQIMILIMLVVCVGTGYTLFRYQPLQEEFKQVEASLTKTRQDLNTITFPNDPPYERSKLEKDLAEVKERVLAAQDALQPLEDRFIPLHSGEDLLTLKLDISSMAKASGVDIRSNQAYHPTSKTTASRTTQAGNHQTLMNHFMQGVPYKRPLQQLRLTGSFAGIHRFLSGLNQMPALVTIVQFRMETAGQPVSASLAQPLTSTVILAL